MNFLAAIVGIAVSALTLVGVWLKLRSSIVKYAIEAVRQDNEDLRAEVQACKERDKRGRVIEFCIRLTLPEMMRIDRANPVLKRVCKILAVLPVEENDGEWKDLLAQIDAADEALQASRA